MNEDAWKVRSRAGLRIPLLFVVMSCSACAAGGDYPDRNSYNETGRRGHEDQGKGKHRIVPQADADDEQEANHREERHPPPPRKEVGDHGQDDDHDQRGRCRQDE
jgi:hypothetical protein